MSIHIFLNQTCFFVLVYLNWNIDVKKYDAKLNCLPMVIIKNYDVITNEDNFYDQTIDSDIKRYKEIRKLTTVQSKDYTKGCLLDYDCIKNHYTLKTVDLNRQKN